MTADAVPARRRIVLDCDPGLDDAIAILTAAHHGELVGITTVNGNVGIEHTTHNALVTAQIAGLDVPVHRGASRPLIAPTMDAARIHGLTGLGDVALPELTRTVASDDAVAYLCDMARSVDDLHLVAVGPLTNVALALRRDPDLRSRSWPDSRSWAEAPTPATSPPWPSSMCGPTPRRPPSCSPRRPR